MKRIKALYKKHGKKFLLFYVAWSIVKWGTIIFFGKSLWLFFN